MNARLSYRISKLDDCYAVLRCRWKGNEKCVRKSICECREEEAKNEKWKDKNQKIHIQHNHVVSSNIEVLLFGLASKEEIMKKTEDKVLK